MMAFVNHPVPSVREMVILPPANLMVRRKKREGKNVGPLIAFVFPTWKKRGGLLGSAPIKLLTG